MEVIREFFGHLYSGLGGYLALWRRDTKATVWASSLELDAVVKFAQQAATDKFDAYFGISLQREKSATGRGSIEGASVVPGLWADVDFAGKPGDAATKKNYPTRDAAMKAIAAMPAKPTVVVGTGGGIHVYWLFDKPFVIETEEQRAWVAGLVKSWQGLLKSKLFKLGGYGLDSTHDLARVLRIPGTIHTSHPDRKVEIEVADYSVLYTPQAVDGWITGGVELMPAAPAKKNGKSTVVNAAVVVPAFSVTAEADPPGTKLGNLMEASPEFASLWSGKTRRSSPSEYDMSLANYAINAGWTDAEAAALLVAFARKWNPSHLEKLLRVTHGVQDYLKLTIGKAHDRRVSDVHRQAAEQAVDELAIEVREAARENRDPARGLVLQKVSDALGVQVVGFQQTGRREEIYSLMVKQGGRVIEVSVGSAAMIHSSPSRVLERIMAECGRHVSATPKLKKEWGTILAGLISIREFHDLAELELSSRVKSLVEEHLARKAGGYWVDSPAAKRQVVLRGDPFIEEFKLYVCGPVMKRLAHEIDRGICGGDLYVGLRSAGFRQETVSLGGGKSTSRSYWWTLAENFSVSEPPENVLAQSAAPARTDSPK